ncbi:MAG: dTMP kinase [Phycisphaerae bacterium]|jgi:dTMP kinase
MSTLKDILAGRFIVIDGPDGAGKSTQVDLLAAALRQQGLTVCQVRDPGGTAIGEKIRAILLDRNHAEMAVRCELMLYMASRAQLAHQVIQPALAAGQCVLGDRYISSTVAYQGAGGVDAESILAAGRTAVGATWPDLTIVLDLPAEAGLDRVHRPDRVESKDLAYHKIVRKLFLQQAKDDPKHFAAVDASGTKEQVQRRVMDVVISWPWPKAANAKNRR